MHVYKTTNLINGKVYIGQTKRKDHTYIGSGVRLKYAIEKYGRENFVRETLCECSTQEELDDSERYWIEKLDSRNPDVGYNIHKGGTRWNGKDGETAKKISDSLTGKPKTKEHIDALKEAFKNRPPVSDETRKRMSDAHKGRTVWNKGKTGYTTKKKGRKYGKQSNPCQNFVPASKGKPLSDETKRKISESAKKTWAKKRGDAE